MGKLGTKELVEKIKKNIVLHLNPYNLGDMGETTELIYDALGRLEKLSYSEGVSQPGAVAGIEVEQTWEEDFENSKTGWVGSGWFIKGSNYEMIPEGANVEIIDQDKFYNPISGIWHR